jgi:hypothetical protein
VPLYWLCYRHNNLISVIVELGASLVHARMRAGLAGLDDEGFDGALFAGALPLIARAPRAAEFTEPSAMRCRLRSRRRHRSAIWHGARASPNGGSSVLPNNGIGDPRNAGGGWQCSMVARAAEVTEMKPRTEPDDWRMRPRYEPQPPPRERKLDTYQNRSPIGHLGRGFKHDSRTNVILVLQSWQRRLVDACTPKAGSGSAKLSQCAMNLNAK